MNRTDLPAVHEGHSWLGWQKEPLQFVCWAQDWRSGRRQWRAAADARRTAAGCRA